jgi:hypothetical protein
MAGARPSVLPEARYDGAVGGDTDTHAISLGVRTAW